MKSSTWKWITGGLEAFLGFPLIGGLVIMSTAYVPLAIMLILHIITLIVSSQEKTGKSGSIMGIVTSFVSIIPFLGMCLHIATAIVLFVSASRKPSTDVIG